MNKRAAILLSVVLAAVRTFAATQFNMSFSTVQPGGTYKPKNVVAVWVTKSDDTFVKTLLRYADGHRGDLTTWTAAAGSADADAVLGATRPNHTAPVTMVATWDLKNKSGVVVPDGTYKIKMECADGSRSAYAFNFVKDAKAGTRTDPGTAVFKSISIAYVPPAPPNAAPVAVAQSVTTPEDTAKAITLAATDADGNPLTYAVVTSPTHGTLSGTAPALTYTPALNYNGADSFTFRANDGIVNSAPATVSITVSAVNDAPVALAQNVTTPEDTAKAITLVATDVDGNPLTYMVMTAPAHGTLSGTAPALTYTPALNYNGPDSFTFLASDGAVNSGVATVSITVSAVNDAPVAQAQSVSTPEDTAMAILLAATDVEGSSLTYAVVTGPAHGLLSGTPPSVTYTPALNYNGSDSFTFKANDGVADSSPATVSIAVTAVNDAPVAQPQSVSTPQDTVQAITLAATDVDGDSLTYTVVTGPAHCMLSGMAPNLSYTPAPGYVGADGFTFKANDGTVDSAVVMVSIAVTAVNHAPVAQAQSVTTTEDAAKAITLAATDVDGNPLTYAVVTGPAHGVLSGTAPAVTYTPALNYSGADSFTFKANDGTADSLPATVSIAVSSVNDAPVAQAQSVSTPEDTAKAVTLAATDVDGNPLTYTVVTGPAHGTLSGATPTLTYAPALNYNGPDSFTFKANDGTADSAPATVSVTVSAVNDAPVAQAQSVTTPEDTAKAVVLAATDADGNLLTYTVVTAPAHGTLSGVAPNVTYTPVLNYNGPDSFTFKANDGTVDAAPAMVAITVTAVNDAPAAQAQSVATPEGAAKAVTLAATDVDGNPLTYAVVAGPAHGALSGVAPSLSYTPAAGYMGTDSFTFKANDGTVDSAVATVSITVTAVNHAPVAQAQSITTPEDTAQAITLAATDVDGNALAYAVVTGPTHGTLSGTAPAVTYTPALNYAGADSFTFKVNDGTVDSAPASVSITVTAVNDAPVAQAQSVSTPEDTAKAVTLAATDVEGSPLTYAVVTGPAHGTLSGTAPAVSYTPALNYSGADSFTFKANDGAADSAPVTVSITVSAVNDVPIAQAQSVPTPEDTAKIITLAAIDVDGNPLTYAVVAGPTHGTLSGTAPAVTYTPALNYTGTDGFSFKANDGTLDSAPATVAITVTAVNDAPVAQAQSVSTPEETAVAITLAATDADGNPLTNAVVTGPAHGTLSGTAPAVTYTPALNYAGADSFTFKASDGTLDSAPATVSITVSAVNDVPVAQAQSATTSTGVAKVITLAATDVDGNVLTYAVVTAPAHGTLSGAAPALTYTPAPGYSGPDSFTFKANDGALDSVPATVSITVTLTAAQQRTLTVVSAYGGATPGTATMAYGTLVDAFVTNSPLVAGTTRYVCAGATVSGNTYRLVNATNVTLKLISNATLRWRWTTQVWLDTATTGNGSVNVSDGWRTKGTSVRITATPGTRAVFLGWRGQTTGCTIIGRTITVPMSMARTITAAFTGTAPVAPATLNVTTRTAALSSTAAVQQVGVADAAATEDALLVRVLDVSLPANTPDGAEIAEVTFSGGTVQATATIPASLGTSSCSILVEGRGLDANGDGMPDVIATALGGRVPEGARLLTIRYTDGGLIAATPFARLLSVAGGGPVPPGSGISAWQLVPVR